MENLTQKTIKDKVCSSEKISNIFLSEKLGFESFSTESISSNVFIKNGYLYKFNNRDSVKRQILSYKLLRNKLKGFEDHIPDSDIVNCEYKGENFTCVIQKIIKGKEIKNLEKKK